MKTSKLFILINILVITSTAFGQWNYEYVEDEPDVEPVVPGDEPIVGPVVVKDEPTTIVVGNGEPATVIVGGEAPTTIIVDGGEVTTVVVVPLDSEIETVIFPNGTTGSLLRNEKIEGTYCNVTVSSTDGLYLEVYRIEDCDYRHDFVDDKIYVTGSTNCTVAAIPPTLSNHGCEVIMAPESQCDYSRNPDPEATTVVVTDPDTGEVVTDENGVRKTTMVPATTTVSPSIIVVTDPNTGEPVTGSDGKPLTTMLPASTTRMVPVTVTDSTGVAVKDDDGNYLTTMVPIEGLTKIPIPVTDPDTKSAITDPTTGEVVTEMVPAKPILVVDPSTGQAVTDLPGVERTTLVPLTNVPPTGTGGVIYPNTPAPPPQGSGLMPIGYYEMGGGVRLVYYNWPNSKGVGRFGEVDDGTELEVAFVSPNCQIRITRSNGDERIFEKGVTKYDKKEVDENGDLVTTVEPVTDENGNPIPTDENGNTLLTDEDGNVVSSTESGENVGDEDSGLKKLVLAAIILGAILVVLLLIIIILCLCVVV